MVAHSGATVRADRLRPLSVPRPIRVKADERGRPLAVCLTTKWVSVIDVLDRWRVDDEWWRQEISRMYFRVALAPLAGEPGAAAPFLLTIFHDLIDGSWFLQTTASAQPEAEPVHWLAPRTSRQTVAQGTAAGPNETDLPIRHVGVA